MAGAERSIDIDAPIEVVYKTVTDYEKYPEFLKDVTGARIIQRLPDGVILEETLSLVKTVTIQIKIVETPNSGIRWALHGDGGLLKKNDGGWRLEDLGGRTRATYFLEVAVGMWVPGKIVDSLTGTTLPATLEAFKKRAEGLK